MRVDRGRAPRRGFVCGSGPTSRADPCPDLCRSIRVERGMIPCLGWPGGCIVIIFVDADLRSRQGVRIPRQSGRNDSKISYSSRTLEPSIETSQGHRQSTPLAPGELAEWLGARVDELARRWSLAIRDHGPGDSGEFDVVLDAFTRHLPRFLPWMLGPYREMVDPLWIKSSEFFGSVAARRGLAAGEVIEEFQLLRELVIRDLYRDPPLGGRLPLSLREILRLNRGIDRGVTHASVGHTDALFFQFFEGEGTPPLDPADLSEEVLDQLATMSRELDEVVRHARGREVRV